MEEASIIRNIKFNVSFFVIDENSNTRYQYVIDFQYERDWFTILEHDRKPFLNPIMEIKHTLLLSKLINHPTIKYIFRNY